MNPEQFKAMLADLILSPPAEPKRKGGFNVDAWCHNTAAMMAQNVTGQNPALRMDTATALFEQQLQHIMAKSYDQPYPGLKARSYIPMATGIPVGAETVVQRGYDISGNATIIAGEGTDVQRVSLQGAEQHIPIVGLAVKWAITLQQMQAAAMAQVDLDAKGLLASRTIVEREIDSLLSVGDATLNIEGICNQATKAWAAVGAGVNLAAVGVPAAFVATWNTVATAAQIMNDFAILLAFFRGGNIYEPTHCLMGSGTYARLESLIATAGDPKTVLEVFRARYPNISFENWWRLDTAGAAGGERVMLYAKDPMVVEGAVSQEPIYLQPVWTGLGYETITYARCGGIQAADTTGIVYADM